MKVKVDRTVCGLNGECMLAAPDVFRLVDGQLVYDATPDEKLRAAVEETADACPTQAISLLGD